MAASVVAGVLGGASLPTALERVLVNLREPRERAFVQALAYGSVRWYYRLQVLLQQLCNKPIRDPALHALLIVGLYQLIYSRVKPHAAVAETVAAAGSATWARGLVNGVLRNFLRHQAALERAVDADPAAAAAHPKWFVKRLRAAWPDHWQAMLTANNATPPFSLRVNRRRISRDGYMQMLTESGRAASASPYGAAAVVLAEPCEVTELPGFGAGLVSVQDVAAQLAAPWLEVRRGQRVLDACAAPGGKTAHLLEGNPELVELWALDLSPQRLALVEASLVRLGLEAHMVAADAGDPSSWWDGRPFDRILLDAPCSATGVIRRHPDIKILRRPADLIALQCEQRRLLEAAWTMLAADGVMVYATCSVLPEENTLPIREFLAGHSDASVQPLPEEVGRSQAPGVQILPGEGDMDGFFYAKLRKCSNG